MRRIRYQVACSLDGFIAAPDDGFDWITPEPGFDLEARVRELRSRPGRDIWLYGGGRLFSQLLRWDLVDTVEPAILPILLGGGVPFLPSPAVRRGLRLAGNRSYPSGMILLAYEVQKEEGEIPSGAAPRDPGARPSPARPPPGTGETGGTA